LSFDVTTTTVRIYTTTVTQVTGCSTSWVSYLTCHTNGFNCVTNGTQVSCSPIRVCETNLYSVIGNCKTITNQQIQAMTITNRAVVYTTNFVAHVACTNDFGGSAVYRVTQSLSGVVAANPDCDQLAGYFPAEATFQATFAAHLQQPGWRGYHTGVMSILSGTNVIATGQVLGSNGNGSQGALEPCAICGHFEGVWQGTIIQNSALKGLQIHATYAGDMPAGTCDANVLPRGPVTLTIDGVVVLTNCFLPAPAGQ